ncbi:MAG: hypothetical protein HY000_04410 [Planctomycetes bacterium]|nr:hypothetical protein [Planctomycetota bacterium]
MKRRIAVTVSVGILWLAAAEAAYAQARFPFTLKKVEDLGPKAEIKLEGKKIIRSAVTRDPGFRLQWRVKEGDKTVAEVNARRSKELLPELKEPGTYTVVLELYYPVYKPTSDRKGEYRPISNVLEYKVEAGEEKEKKAGDG